MSADALPLLSRLVDVERLPGLGGRFRVEANEEERAALARLYKLPGIASLTGDFVVSGDSRRAKVKGQVRAEITQTCVVTLEPIPGRVEEEVDLVYAEAAPAASPEEAERRLIDPPDEIVGGRIDLGALTAEYLALGVDPYPRKDDASFAPPEDAAETDSPFAALRKLKPGE